MVTKVIRRTETIQLAGARVPSVMLIPQLEAKVPGVLLLHGYSSSKERLSNTMGKALAGRGIATLAIDLPLHGARDDEMVQQARSNPLALIQHWKKAIVEAKDAVAWLIDHESIDSNCVAVAGYSLGSYIALQVAVSDKRVKCVVLAAGGDLPPTKWIDVMRMVVDPLASVSKLGGRPLLMLHGMNDRTIHREQAEQLYRAASDPKRIIWYSSGHILPPAAGEDAAKWLMEQFELKS